MYDPALPPQNIEAEESILGGILLDPKAMGRIVDFLAADAFYLRSHQEIYRAAVFLHGKGKPTDVMTVSSWLQDYQLLDEVGGIPRLLQLIERTVSAANIDRYAELVMDKYVRRQLIGTGGKVIELARDTTRELDEVLDGAEQEVFLVSNWGRTTRTLSNGEVASAAFTELEKNNPIYPTGLRELDNLIVGFEPGTLTLLAGRPSMGKSQAALFLALQMMVARRIPVVFFSLEMTAQQLEYRLWSLLSVHPHYCDCGFYPLRSGRIRQHRAGLAPLTEREHETIARVLGIATELPLYLNDDRGTTVVGIASECRRLISEKKKPGLVVVDYLQMMADDSPNGNRSYELGNVARGLYKMAGDLNVPVLALSQISRAVEGRNNKRPVMADLSQSGILEMVSDNVVLLYRDEYYNPDSSDRDVLELIVGKARHGLTGTARFLFDKSYGLLTELPGGNHGN
ncbi:MAG: replicative DNA helicase [Microcystis aeruginosa SX13-01]|jgi:replicative DNA helicase|uniref:Replicative DNA helicase n=2 Tax=Microcystis aeruginosa TaxID=1126 RepID=A0A552EB84_MICAE|nr:replicative DNA helicase [Microcystis aeruginosa SX13-01]NCS04491.1 replicative DNA helicase [Microcystis aeruginosa G13-11]TRT83610.1 MAG: replicative DNA helicase [Microcystis aeruginosa Ma_AC_P_19900807_S299]TRU23316.1 MAG: replicative DNA helicase [Microcystis aeruginosa Ma_SC_T_19800800_S464]TRU31737.1 MAG: replicative DNA helicase [Microcystis aeruginosa Ma_QC_B_20070730_S2]